MPTPRRLLWFGPASANLRARAVEDRGEDDGLWIVATPLAHDQLVIELTRRRTSPQRPGVFAWDDLWIEAARRHQRPPSLLSDAAARAGLVAAIGQSRRDDTLGPLDPVADLPGLRRRLRSRFDRWSLDGRNPEAPAPPGNDVVRAEWSVFRRYRAILADLNAVDTAGLAWWAAGAIGEGALGAPGSITIVDPVAVDGPCRRVIEWAARAEADVLVTLPWTGDPDDPSVGPMWELLTQRMGFEEEESPAGDSSLRSADESSPPPLRGRVGWGVDGEGLREEPPTLPSPSRGEGFPEDFARNSRAGLAFLEANLFNPEPDSRPPSPTGLSLLGGPNGEGLALILSREVVRRLDAGINPDDLLILVPRWDDDATRAIEVLNDAGIAVAGGGPRRLATDPVVAALLLAAGVAPGGWEATAIVRLLRNGAIAPDWADAAARAEAASAIASLRVFRGRPAIAAALDPTSRARTVFDQLAIAVDGPNARASWSEQCDRLRAIARSLGLASDGTDVLWDAVDDHTLIPAYRDGPIDRARFVAEVESLARDLLRPGLREKPGSVRFATIAEAEGVRARVILVTNLAEGSFPSRESVTAEATDEAGVPVAFTFERLAMLRLLGSARDELVLLVPTSDEKGGNLLPAGFVEDVRHSAGIGINDVARLDPSFREHPDLAVTAADRRVLAVARACLDRDRTALTALAREPEQREAMEGVASALRLARHRWRIRHFTEYDGRLNDPNVVARIAAALGPDHAFSASQLESFALCPFQFFLRYVLRIDPVDEKPELRVDLANRGMRLHAILEEIHAAISAEGVEEWQVRDRVAAFIAARLAEAPDDDAADVAAALRVLEEIDVRRSLRGYAREFAAYHEGSTAHPEHFEWSFGLDPDRPGSEPSAPELVIESGGQVVRLRGKIDRIDRTDGGFRVIDYKTGHAPKPGEVTTSLRAVQLPLYALAVEAHLHGGAESRDFGYWTLGGDGFKSVKLKETWPEFRGRIIAEVARLVGLLRGGAFPVEPRHPDCRRFCDYRTACRIGQVQLAGKEPLTIIS